MRFPPTSEPDVIGHAAHLLAKDRFAGKVVPQDVGWWFDRVFEERTRLVNAIIAELSAGVWRKPEMDELNDAIMEYERRRARDNTRNGPGGTPIPHTDDPR